MRDVITGSGAVRVLLDGSAALRGPGGTAVYVERLAGALEREGARVHVVADRARRAPGGGGAASARNAAHDARWAARLGRARGVDVVHHPLPALAPAARAAQVVTVHDLAFLALPGAFDARFRRYAALVHRAAARRADAVVVPSRATAAELRARWGVDAVVAPHGPGHDEPPLPRAEPPTHFLYVGDAEPRKDVPGLLAAHAAYAAARAGDALPLVLAGRAGEPAGEEASVVRVGRVSAAGLAALHAGAAALVHAARHEGFGLTVLEALAAGTPVLAVRSPAVAEVAGDAALLVAGAPALTAQLHRLHDEPRLRAELARRGPERAAALTWRASARAHLGAYAAAAAARSARTAR